MRMMGLAYQLRIQLDRAQLAYQKEKTLMDYNLFLLDGRICMLAQTCILHVVHSECKVEHPDFQITHQLTGKNSLENKGGERKSKGKSEFFFLKKKVTCFNNHLHRQGMHEGKHICKALIVLHITSPTKKLKIVHIKDKSTSIKKEKNRKFTFKSKCIS